MATMLGNLGVHIIQFPSGRWGFVGSLPKTLGDVVKATRSDILGGRVSFHADGTAYAVKFPTFETIDQAQQHAEERGVAVQN